MIKVKNISKEFCMYEFSAVSIKQRIELLKKMFKGQVPKLENRIFKALDNVSFDIKKGESVAILGKNGAGKSTLLKILSRIISPTSGTVDVNGRVTSLLEVGAGFHDELTGYENIRLNAAVMGMHSSELKRKESKILEFAGLGDFINVPLKRYSSGMKLKLGFSVAIHMEPDILIADEILAVGDISFQKKCLDKLAKLKEAGSTLLFVSHHMETIQRVCDRGIVIEDGKVTCDEPIGKAVDFYLNSLDVETSIDERKDRRGAGKIKFIKVDVEKEGKLVTSGGKLHLKFKITPYRGHYTAVVKFLNPEGAPVFTCDGRIASSFYDMDGFSLIIPKLPLLPGNYSLSVFLHAEGRMQDNISNVRNFQVESGNVNGLKIERHSHEVDGDIFVEHFWTPHP